jgi:serine/threonine protein kinase/tetratricopeptide (TPR) repeat protein
MTASRLTESKIKSESEGRVVEVLDAYLAADQEGRAPAREELLAQYPELAEDLEACLASLEFIRQASLTAPPLVADSRAVKNGDAGLGDLGDFRILREIGRGGMGVVYEAVQRSLNRRVALKVLPFAAAMDPIQLRRFQTEALASAQLHHTHIVPVYSVGCERGVHHYAMQFIEGPTLAQAIAERRQSEGTTKGEARSDLTAPTEVIRSVTPSPSSRTREFFRMVAELGIQAAAALDHAHKLGVVHRDIKPANLMLDVGGNLWVTDFGLARLQDDTGLTISGDLLGTLRYMSPEQALAKRGYLDHRTDIYSLGATMYELLTLRPAIDGQDRQEVLRKIAQEEPASPRRLNPSIPRELETIVSKAIAKEPESRYATGQELADDLRRFLEDKPIRAKRPTLPERAAKWSRRHAGAVVSAILLLVMAVAALSISMALVARERRGTIQQRDRANDLADEARIQRGLAEEQARLARQAVDEMYTEVAERWLAGQARLEPLQREFLEKALRFYEKFAQAKTDDPQVRMMIAKSLWRAGDIRSRLGLHKEAEDAYRRALAIDHDLAATSPAATEPRLNAANDAISLGALLLSTGRHDDAERLYLEAREIAQNAMACAPTEAEPKRLLAMSQENLGFVQAARGRTADARQHYQQAITLYEGLTAGSDAKPSDSKHLANAFNNLGNLHWSAKRLTEAEVAYRRARDIMQRLVDKDPTQPNHRETLAYILNNLSAVLQRSHHYEESERVFRQAIDVQQRLADDFPSVPDYLGELASFHGNLGVLLRSMGRAQQGKEAFQQAVALLQELTKKVPDRPENQLRLCVFLRNLGNAFKDERDWAHAEHAYGRALEIQSKLAADYPDVPNYREELGGIHNALGHLLWQEGRPAEAEASFGAALTIFDRLATGGPDRGEIWERLGGTNANWVTLLTLGSSNGGQDPGRALRLAEQAVARCPRNRDAWGALGIARSQTQDQKGAIAAIEKALALDHLEDGDLWMMLALAHARGGDRQQARTWYDKAVALMRRQPPGVGVHPMQERLRAEAAALLGMTDQPKPPGNKEQTSAKPSKP